ncbi:MAG: hypothetical protein FJ216_10730 [Ignavibacteria bacterium]|nr:hypothetical protein [Ignavibacteria bacterium]
MSAGLTPCSYKLNLDDNSIITGYSSREVIYNNLKFSDINASLDGRRNLSNEVIEYKIVLDSSLEKAKTHPYNQEVYRGTDFGDYDNLNTGDFFTENKFLSTSLNKEKALEYGNNYLFIIKSKTGKFIKPISLIKADEEVLFGTNKTFKILNTKFEGKTKIIYCEEI